MNLKGRTIEELKKIMSIDYHIKLTNDEASELGLSLLRLTRLGIINTVQNKYKSRKPPDTGDTRT